MNEDLRFVTIEHFIIDMMGYKSKVTYYNNRDLPGWPQRVWPSGPEGRPMLVLDECLAYMRRVLKARAAEEIKPMPPAGSKKRHPGRPAKVVSAA